MFDKISRLNIRYEAVNEAIFVRINASREVFYDMVNKIKYFYSTRSGQVRVEDGAQLIVVLTNNYKKDIKDIVDIFNGNYILY